jgi:multiple sugar transport system permease protein
MNAAASTRRQVVRQREVRKTIIYLVLTAVSLITLAPLIWMIITAIKPEKEIFRNPPTFIPETVTLDNFNTALGSANFLHYMTNSLIYAGVTTLLMLVLASTAGFALARLNFRGRDFLFLAILALLLVPAETHLIPNFLLIKHVPFAGGNDWLGNGGRGWINSFPGLIVPGAVTPFGVFFMRQFFVSMPKELEDAARMDGASYLQIFRTIMLPLARAPLATLSILTFVGTWNAFTWPLIVTNSESHRTLQLGLQVFQDSNNVQMWGVLMAASLISVAPLIALFLLAQRYFIESFAYSGIK